MGAKNSDVEVYISEIAERLWSGHASIMVGAGFSMNVHKSEVPLKKFPSWNELGDVFYHKLYGKVPTDKERGYLDAIKLAEEVEASFGRSALNKIIRDEVPDTEYQPSELHTKLLQLPWTDIFTTNYDTLLERGAEKILEQRYETIINKEDLVWSTKPRIIKLHGSFPSERPFIITEDDYRKYPSEYAPFVNTVQQSLLENTLCLIGFSGNDPNFLKWIGWIRDNLGKSNSPKIFLVGKLTLSIGQKKLLQDKNIVPIDLSCYSDSHYDALMEFLRILKDKGSSTEANLDFPMYEKAIYFDYKQKLEEQFEKAITVWRNTRLSYPNWLILPERNREWLSSRLKPAFLYHIKDIRTAQDIEFLYEFNWRIEKCLLPIINDWIPYYESVISKYNPFISLVSIENAEITPITNEELDWKVLTNYWVELQLSLLRYYREENFKEKWKSLSDIIKKIERQISPELLAKYRYEVCLYFLFQLDIASVRKELNDWAINESLPYWEAKRAGLLAELGNVEIAEKILETSLTEIRNRLKFSPVKNDYTFVSQEAYILQLSRYIRRSTSLTNAVFGNKDDYSERWNELIKYKCDPWGELTKFETTLRVESKADRYIDKKYNFKIGSTTTTHYLSKESNYITTSYAFLRYIEEIGFPLKLAYSTFGKKPAEKAISCISNYSPNWGFVSFIRTGNVEILDNIFNRKSLFNLSQNDCDELATTYLEVLIKSASEINEGDTYNNENFAISISKVVPQILSRLCVKCNYGTKIKILQFLKSLYSSDLTTKNKYGKINNLVATLIQSFTNSEKYFLLPELLDFLAVDNSELNNSFPDLFEFLEFKDLRVNKSIKISSKKIDETISLLNSDGFERRASIVRLIVLWKNHLLNKTQENRFAKGLWKFRDANGFPKDSAYFYFVYISLPHPENVNPKELLNSYFKNQPFPIEGKKEKGEGIGITGGDHLLFHNIKGTSNIDIIYKWDKDEINSLIANIIKWWNTDKEYLLKTDDGFAGSIADEFKARFRNMVRVFSEIIVFETDFINSTQVPEIKKILNELAIYNIPDLEAKASFIKVFPQTKNVIYENINLQLYSKNEEKILDAINAVYVLTSIEAPNLEMIIKNISENIKIRTEVGLDKFLHCMMFIINTNHKLIDENILNDLQIGLEYLLKELIINDQDVEKTVHNKLLVKQEAGLLLVTLRKLYSTFLKTEVPEYIVNWENACMDINEFSDIRNVFINAI